MTQHSTISTEQEQMWRRYHRMQTYLMGVLDRELTRTTGLSAADYDVLITLWEAPGHRLRARELRRQLLWEKSRLSHQLRRMEQRSLLGREECAEDSRGAVVALTSEGLDVIRSAECARLTAVRSHLIDAISDDQLEALADISALVLAHLEHACAPHRALADIE